MCLEGKDAQAIAEPLDELGGESVVDELLTPTRIYVKPVRAIVDACPQAVRALAHITGGGITENLNRALNDNVDALVEVGTWPLPPIVRYTCQAANLSTTEALKTFNMGLGLVLIVAPEAVDAVCEAARAAGEEPYLVGRIEAGSGIVRYEGEENLFD